MAKSHQDRDIQPGNCAAPRAHKFRTIGQPAIGFYVGLAFAIASGQSLAQSTPQILASQEQRRAEERDRAQREQQERTSDVRLQTAASVRLDRLPIERVCFHITELKLTPAPSEPAFDETASAGADTSAGI